MRLNVRQAKKRQFIYFIKIIPRQAHEHQIKTTERTHRSDTCICIKYKVAPIIVTNEEIKNAALTYLGCFRLFGFG